MARRTCGWPGCTEPAITERNGVTGRSLERAYCGPHLRLGYAAATGTGQGSHSAGGRPYLSPEQEADVVRRIRRFESPKALAREYGITVGTVRAIVKRR